MRIVFDYVNISFYTLLIAIGMSMMAMIITVRYATPNKMSSLLIIYFTAFIFINTLSLLNDSLKQYVGVQAIINTETIFDLSFTLLEFLIFIYIFKLALKNKAKIIQIINIIFLITTGFYLFSDLYYWNLIRVETLQRIFSIQAICLIILSLIYYREVFNTTPSIDLKNINFFWIITGIFFLMTCTLPFSIFLNYLIRNNFVLFTKLYSIFYIFYSLLFLMIAKASLCKPALTK